ncbi:SIS domain-containing protein [Wenxinia saemankumensis]|uniref:Galactosamine 6-phosphate isomerase AgaS n=1 Tax=Wenxinia saemankumensis TaxID=1447782 RepID=A0A1M6HPB8_9RHOB|nr:phosphosugar isomerase [Wenxinia saemankumensis]SHJ23976.1 galactosamine 6-phosphate isomerase AgaS [Wenxinia saemankumensis]
MTLATTATWTEIHRQPEIWESWAPELAARAGEIRRWIAARGIEEVWLSGAGTSAFIGDVLAAGPPPLRPDPLRPDPLRLVPVPTTDIVACPQDVLGASGRILSLQFGRSGDSSESVGLLDLLDAHRPDIDRLHVTCNADGALATRVAPGPGEARALVLPSATHDAGFAMTSSFTTMLLSAAACLGICDAAAALPRLAAGARALLPALASRPAPRPGRAVFLGSGALKGVARESALKVLELTAGRTITQWDSPLGYRHGPKSAVDGATSVYVLLHPDPGTRRYDADVADEIARQFPDIPVTTIGPGGDIAVEGTGDPRLDAALYVLPAQILSARWSQELGLPVDDPFQGRNLTRVVTGVTLYDYVPA